MIMKRVNLLTVMTALWLTAVVGFTSCTNTDAVDTAEGPSPRTVTFNISLPNGDPVRYTRAQDATEYTLTSLKLLSYDAATDLLEAAAETVSPTANTNDGSTYTWSKSFGTDPAAKNPARRFVFVGNDDTAIGSLAAGAAYDDLASIKCTPTIAAGTALSSVFSANNLPMSGIAKQTGGTDIISLGQSATAAATVEMVRCVARIDVKNTVTNLVITGLTLDNVVSKGYLMPPATLAAADAKVSNVGLFTALPAGGLTTSTNDGVTLAKAFYVYEDAAGADDILTLNVKGTVSGVPVYYSIPFKVKYTVANSTDESGIAIERNHLYTVQLGNGAPIAVNTSVQPTIVSAVWVANADVQKAFSSEIFNVDGVANAADYEVTTQNIHISSAVPSGLTINVSDDYYRSGDGFVIASVEVNDGSGWGTLVNTTSGEATGAGASADRWLTATFTSAQTVTITTSAANTGAQRIGQIRIKYKQTPDAQTSTATIFTVTQAANS